MLHYKQLEGVKIMYICLEKHEKINDVISDINILTEGSDFEKMFPLLIHSWVTFP